MLQLIKKAKGVRHSSVFIWYTRRNISLWRIWASYINAKMSVPVIIVEIRFVIRYNYLYSSVIVSANIIIAILSSAFHSVNNAYYYSKRSKLKSLFLACFGKCLRADFLVTFCDVNIFLPVTAIKGTWSRIYSKLFWSQYQCAFTYTV
jgi:hypothetical protein